jgi:hypothetical protein
MGSKDKKKLEQLQKQIEKDRKDLDIERRQFEKEKKQFDLEKKLLVEERERLALERQRIQQERFEVHKLRAQLVEEWEQRELEEKNKQRIPRGSSRATWDSGAASGGLTTSSPSMGAPASSATSNTTDTIGSVASGSKHNLQRNASTVLPLSVSTPASAAGNVQLGSPSAPGPSSAVSPVSGGTAPLTNSKQRAGMKKEPSVNNKTNPKIDKKKLEKEMKEQKKKAEREKKERERYEQQQAQLQAQKAKAGPQQQGSYIEQKFDGVKHEVEKKHGLELPFFLTF